MEVWGLDPLVELRPSRVCVRFLLWSALRLFRVICQSFNRPLSEIQHNPVLWTAKCLAQCRLDSRLRKC